MDQLFDGLFWSETNVKTLIPATLAMVLLAILAKRLLGKQPDRIKNIPFQVIAGVLVILEIVKQVKEIQSGYESLWALPLHFSSIYLFLYPLAHFTRGNFARVMRSVAVTTSGMTTIGTLLFPMTIFGDAAGGYFAGFGSFHTITYHYAIILYFLLFTALGMNAPETKKDAKNLFFALSTFAGIAAFAANMTGVNFMSFRFASYPPIEAMRLSAIAAWGAVPGQVFYVTFMYLALLATGVLSTVLYRFLDLAFRPRDCRKTAVTAAPQAGR